MTETSHMTEALMAPAPVAMFQGCDSVTGAGRSTAIGGQTEKLGGQSGFTARVCQDISSLAQTLKISQSLSVSYGPIGSFDEKMEFMRSLNVTTNSISIVVSARHVLGTEVAKNVAVSDDIRPPSKDKDISEFFNAYGDSYVASRTLGGEYFAVYTFYSETREQKDTLAIEMKAHGISGALAVNASLQAKLDTLTKTTKTRYELSQTISGIQNPELPDRDNIVAYALSFPSLELDAPAIISFESNGYERVPKFGDFGAVPANRKYFVGSGLVDGLTASLLRVQELRNQIAWLQETYQFYGFSGDTKLTEAASKADTDLEAINGQIQAWEEYPVQSFKPPPLPSLELGTPSLNYEIGYSDAYGGAGGAPFTDVNPTTYIQQRSSISNIQLRSGKYVDQLIVTYQSSAGSKRCPYGGGGGHLSAPLTLLVGQFVKRIDVRSGKYVDQVKITLTDDRFVGGGGGGGTPRDWTVPSGSFVLGFRGRSGKYLDRLQVIYATINAANWQ